jgi:molybdate transport system ATP-binding protein
MLRFDIATHAAKRNQLSLGERVHVSLLAEGIHLMPAQRTQTASHNKRNL